MAFKKRQALEKLRGKNGDKKITAKDGFCMQKWLAKDYPLVMTNITMENHRLSWENEF